MKSSGNKLAVAFSIFKQSLQGKEYDYTTGSIKRAIVLIAIPMILELGLESVFAVVDMFFVGKLGSDAAATVGLTESFITLVYSVAIGLSTAATAIVARRTGEKNEAGASNAAMQVIMMALVVSVIMSIAGYIAAPDILRIMGATDSIIQNGIPFARTMLGGSFVIVFLFLINGIFRGAGNPAIAMKSLWLASITNIILCPVLINGIGPFPHLGLTGAAVATTIGRALGVVYQLYHLRKGSGTLKLRSIAIKPDFAIMKNIIALAWPATLQFIISSGSWIVLTALVAHSGGADASAGYQIAIRNIVFFILPAWGLSNAAATLVGQNLGADKPDRAEKSVYLTTLYNVFFMLLVTLIFLFFAPGIIGVFTNSPSVHATGTLALRIVGAGFAFYGIGMVMIQSLNGAGDTRTPTLINLSGFWLFQIPLAYILTIPLHFGPVGAFMAVPIAETAIAIAAFIYFRTGKWKKVSV